MVTETEQWLPWGWEERDYKGTQGNFGMFVFIILIVMVLQVYMCVKIYQILKVN